MVREENEISNVARSVQSLFKLAIFYFFSNLHFQSLYIKLAIFGSTNIRPVQSLNQISYLQ